MKSGPLFEEFQSSAEAEWREAAGQILKGRSIEQAFESDTWEGIRRRPIYHAADWTAGDGAFTPEIRSGWLISQGLAVPEPAEFNRALMALLERGQGLVGVRVSGVRRRGLSLGSLDDLDRAFLGLLPNAVGYRFSGASGAWLLALFDAWLDRVGADRTKIEGCLGINPFAEALGSDGSRRSVENRIEEAAVCGIHNLTHLPHFRAGQVNTLRHHEAGANSVVELGISLAAGLSLVREFCERGMSIEQGASQVSFVQAVGGDFFMEIAALRAARPLWSRVIEELGGGEEARVMKLHVRTGRYNKTRRASHTNLVRATSEALSAVIGGVDSLDVGRFDEVSGGDSEFSRRIAVNLQLVLQEECGLDVADPAGGSYYVEALTAEVAEKAWKVFREIEGAGGYVNASRAGMIRSMIDKAHHLRSEALARRRASLVGVNCYVRAGDDDLNETLDDRACGAPAILPRPSGLKTCCAENLISTLVLAALDGVEGERLQQMVEQTFPSHDMTEVPEMNPHRLALEYEHFMDLVGKHVTKAGEDLKLEIVLLGDPGMCRPRAEFVREFFGMSGLVCGETTSPPDKVDDVLTSMDGRMVVICADPAVGEEEVRAAIGVLKNSGRFEGVLVAMYPPEERGCWEKAGLNWFVYRGCDHLGLNREVLAALGVSLGVESR